MELVFSIGGSIRRVVINGRVISFLTAETSYLPLVIDLDKLGEDEYKKKLKDMKADVDFLKELRDLQTEEEISRDIIRDFQKTGWRLIKRK